MRKSFILILCLFLAACNLPHATPQPVLAPSDSSQEPCAFNWSSHALPDVSKQVQADIDSAGIAHAVVQAEAYGEDCYDARTNQSVGFGAMETDFHLTVQVPDLSDAENLGSLLEQIMQVLDKYSPGSVPGPEPGYIGVTFKTGETELNVSFQSQAGQAARDNGLHGSRLLEELRNK